MIEFLGSLAAMLGAGEAPTMAEAGTIIQNNFGSNLDVIKKAIIGGPQTMEDIKKKKAAKESSSNIGISKPGLDFGTMDFTNRVLTGGTNILGNPDLASTIAMQAIKDASQGQNLKFNI